MEIYNLNKAVPVFVTEETLGKHYLPRIYIDWGRDYKDKFWYRFRFHIGKIDIYTTSTKR